MRFDLQAGPIKEVIEASVRQEVDRVVTKYTTDQKIAEIDITEKVTNRLFGWVKLLGSAFGLLLAAAGFLGIKGLLDLQHDAEKGVKSELKNGIAAEAFAR